MGDFSIKNRQRNIKLLKSKEFDLILIGGGITGAGVFLDAQQRGLSCCLVEMQDFAEGTSSRSTKLIHGGLRYLKQGNFRLVRETGKERNVVAYIARHLTHPKEVLMPTVKGGSFSKLQLKFALWVYEKLAHVPKELRHSSYSKNEFINALPGVQKENLLGGISYVEYQTNDSRLTIEVIKKAVELGGVAVSRLRVSKLIEGENGVVTSIRVKDIMSDDTFTVNGKCVINATGPWTDNLLAVKSNSIMSKIKPTKGVHLVFDQNRFPLSKATYFDTPDKRMIFAIPEDGKVYVGTTDTFYKGDLTNPTITKSDVDYLLAACNNMFSELDLKSEDIVGGWSGIRPLIDEKNKKPSEISRKYEIYQDASGVLSIAGGKLTGYRKMAEKIVNTAIDKHFHKAHLDPCNTSTLRLAGSEFESNKNYSEILEEFLDSATKLGWKEEEAKWVFSQFGSQAEAILNLQVIAGDIPEYLHKTVLYTLDNEAVQTPTDFFVRRTNLFNFHFEAVRLHYDRVSQIINSYVNLKPDQIATDERKFNAMLDTLKKIKQSV